MDFQKIMILGIETSCDESAVALFDDRRGIIFEDIASQISLHSEYGGVVPALASREHTTNLPKLLQRIRSFGVNEITHIAVTTEPGLPGCLSIGIAAAKALSLVLGVPVVRVDHLHGHLLSPFIPLHEENPEKFFHNLKSYLPHLGLLASGGNTILFLLSEDFQIDIIAETVDDAAGEAFDKGAKLLGFPYPGGQMIEKFAKHGRADKYHFPRAFSEKSDMKFSFSGLKTSLRYFLDKRAGDFFNDIHDICASYQEAIVDALTQKTQQAIGKFNDIRSIGLSGGVSNNDRLRGAMSALAKEANKNIFFPRRQHTGDNASMIAFAAFCQTHSNVQ